MRHERHPSSTFQADEAMFARFLQEADAVDSHTTLDRAVLHAVQKALLARQVAVTWFHGVPDASPQFQRGARVAQLRAQPEQIDAFDQLPTPIQQPMEARFIKTGIWSQVSDHPEGIDFRLRWTDRGRLVELRLFITDFMDNSRSRGAARRSDLVQTLRVSNTMLGNIVQILRPMHRFAQDSIESETRRAVEEWLSDSHRHELHHAPDIRDHALSACALVTKAGALLQRMETAPCDRQRIALALERMVRSMVHRVMSAGWRTLSQVPSDLPVRESEGLEQLVECLARLPEEAPATESERMSVYRRLHLLRLVLRSAAQHPHPQASCLQQTLAFSTDGDLDGEELRLFAAWSVMHDIAHAGVHSPPLRAEPDEVWPKLLEHTRHHLPAILAAWTRPLEDASAGRDPHNLGAVRNWLFLWFAHHIVTERSDAVDAPAPRAEGWRRRRALAQVIRETLRAKLYGASPGYTRHTRHFTCGLRRLVGLHVAPEPEVAFANTIRGHLALVADQQQLRGARFASDHLQHVLEVYIAGHFLLSCTLVGPGVEAPRPPTAAEVLAHPNGLDVIDATRTQDLLTAWSLSALYHDSGLALFPEFRTPRAFQVQLPYEIQTGTNAIVENRATGGTNIATTARDALVKAGIYDPNQEAPLANWIERQVQTGHTNHALTSAWYLQCALHQLEDLSPRIRRAAVRAVLLHAAPSLVVDTSKDPVASLLALFDELFDWDPSLTASLPSDALQLSRPVRSAAIQFTQVEVRVSPAGHLETTLHLDRGAIVREHGHPPSWPRVKLTHIHPEQLDHHVIPLWLAVAQNICRLQSSPLGFGPIIDVHGSIPRTVRSRKQTSEELLDNILNRPTPWGQLVREWYLAPLPIPVSTTEREDDEAIRETRRVFPIGKAITHHDIRADLRDVKRRANELLR